MYQKISFQSEGLTLRDLDKAGIPIFNDWWSTYIPEHKQTLITKIMHTYYFEEIGTDTPDKFIHYINAQLERIMPYYNQLYKSELIKVNPLLNHSIETSGRSIENLVSKANTSDDKFSKAIRDFVGVTDRASNQGVVGHATGATQRDDIGHEEYTKKGTEDITDKKDTTGNEDEKTHETKIANTTIDRTDKETTDSSQNRTLDKTVTETPDETTVKKMDWGATETGKESLTGNTTSDGTGTKNWTETRDDDSTTKTVTDLDETSSSSGEKDYADTPQKQLEVTNENGTASVRRDYLTNVTWTSDSSKHNADTTQDVTFTDDETKTHKEDTTDSNTTDKTETTDTTKQKGGTDTETDTHTGTNVTKTDETENTSLDKTVDFKSDTTQNETVNTDGTRNLNTTENETDTRDRDWTENGSSDSTLNSKTSSVSDSTTKTNTSGTENSRENSSINQSSSAMTEKTSEETTDTGTNQTMTGFMNVSASALLEAFRKTFINIDSMIIEELRDNFMLVY